MLRQQRELSSDVVDGIERHTWGKREYVKGGGSVIKIKGTGTVDEEVLVLQGTSGFHLPDDTDAEVIAFSSSSDTNLKIAMLQVPAGQQREWKENAGGVQSPADGKRALEVNSKRVYADDDKFATRGGVLEVDGNTVYIRGNLVISGDLSVGGSLTVTGIMKTRSPIGPQPVTVPGFDE